MSAPEPVKRAPARAKADGGGGYHGGGAAAAKGGAAADKRLHISFTGDDAVLHRQLAQLAAQVAELRTVRSPLDCNAAVAPHACCVPWR